MSSPRTTALAGAAVVALLVAAAAAADTYSYRLTASDQAAARAVVIHRADLGTTAHWKGGPVKPDRSQLRCSHYNPKHADLVVTGDAAADWTATGIHFESSATIFETDDMVRTDWQRSDTKGLIPCLREKATHGLDTTARVVSVQRIPFPSLSTYTDAFRILVDVTNSGRTGRVLIDTVLTARGRAEIGLVTVAPYALVEPVQAAEARLAVLMAGRAPAF